MNYKYWTAIFFSCAIVLYSCNAGKSKAAVSDSLPGEMGEAERGIFNETGFPIVSEQITLSAIAWRTSIHGDFNQMLSLRRMEDHAGIQLDIEAIPDAGYSQAINLRFAGGDLPDIIFSGPPANFMQYAGELIRPLEGYIENYMPNLRELFQKRPKYRKMSVRSDGHIYQLPRISEQTQNEAPNQAFINKKWLDALGLTVPRTTEEFYQVLKAFKEKDPNGNGVADELPASFMANVWWAYAPLHSFAGAFVFPFDGTYLKVGAGQRLEFVPIAESEDFQKFVIWWQILYQEGLVDIETYSQDLAMFFAKGKTGAYGVFVSWFARPVVGPELSDDYIMLPPLKGPKGRQQWMRNVNSAGGSDVFLLSAQNPYPASTMRFMDLVYDPEYAWQLGHGPWDIVIEELPDGKIGTLPPPEGLTEVEWIWQNTPNTNFPLGLLSDQYERWLGSRSIQRKRVHHKQLLPFFPETDNYVPAINFTNDEEAELAILRTDIFDFFKQSYVKWITRGTDIRAAWPGFVRRLENIGLEKYIEIYQAAYDRFIHS